jgi:peptidoglycan/LPS O-acetylase OafA/YrhL
MFNTIKISKFYSLIFILLISFSIQFFPDTIVNGYFYVNPFFRITDFILGILIFYMYDSKKVEGIIKNRNTFTLIEIGSIMLFLIFFIFHKYIPFGYRLFGYYWIPMSLLILIFSYQSGYISKLLSGKILIILGEISFSFYLIHQIIIKLIYAINKKIQFTENNFLLIALVLFISIFLSYLMYNFVEVPSNRYIKSKLIKNE